MAEYRDAGVEPTGLLRQTLRLAGGIVVVGVAVVFLLDSEERGTGQDGPSVRVPAMPADGGATQSVTSELVLKAGAHGHFMVDAWINGEQLRFLVDTGASAIFLTPRDALTLGWPPERLDFSQRYETANGEVRAAPVILRSLRIGQLEFYDLPASVGEAPGSVSLLGMSFLKRFDSYQVRGDTLILAW